MGEKNEKKITNRKRGKYQMFFNVAFSIICLTVIIIASLSLLKTLAHRENILNQLTQVQANHNQIVEKNRQAQQEFNLVQDEEYLEDVARRDYYYSKEGEIIFDLGEVETTIEESSKEIQ